PVTRSRWPTRSARSSRRISIGRVSRKRIGATGSWMRWRPISWPRPRPSPAAPRRSGAAPPAEMAAQGSLPDARRAGRRRCKGRATRIAYVDPQSYHGLAKYDLGYLRGLLDAGFDADVVFYCSTL